VPSRFKYPAEIAYWQKEWADGRFHNEPYEWAMLTLAQEPDGEFLRDKIVADFGCGPMGSLESVVLLNYCYDLADRGQFSFLIVP